MFAVDLALGCMKLGWSSGYWCSCCFVLIVLGFGLGWGFLSLIVGVAAEWRRKSWLIWGKCFNYCWLVSWCRLERSWKKTGDWPRAHPPCEKTIGSKEQGKAIFTPRGTLKWRQAMSQPKILYVLSCRVGVSLSSAWVHRVAGGESLLRLW